jgi:predicted kinase
MIQNAFLEDAGAEIKKQALRYKTVIFDRLLSKQEDVQRLLDQLGNTSAVHIVRLWSPLELCIERNKRRRPRCEEEGLRKIWEETEPYPGELVIDTSQHSPREVANLIVQKVKTEFAFA